MDLNQNVLVRQAIFGLYGNEVKNLAELWVVKQLNAGKEIPVSLSECFEAYEDFDEVFADEFAKDPNWPVLWKMLNHYDKSDDGDLALPRIAGSVVARFIDKNKTKQLQSWIQVTVNDERMVGVVLEKSKNVPEMLEWCLTYLKKFSAFRDSAALIVLIRDIAVQHPKFLWQAIDLIVYLGKQRGMQHGLVRLSALEAMSQILGTTKLPHESQVMLLGKIEEFAQNMTEFDTRFFLQEDKYLPCAFKISLATKFLKSVRCDGNEDELLEAVDVIYHHGMVNSEDSRLIVSAWCKFVKLLAQKRQDLCYDLFLKLNSALKDYVASNGWEVALMHWNPGMNFSNYAPEFQKMTFLSLELANLSGHFRPRAFLTALNMVIFDETGQYNAEWFENFVRCMPQNADNSSVWDDNFAQLFEHLAMLYRYREEIQKQDVAFLQNEAKVFVSCVMANYALNATQIEQLKSLCSRLQLDVDMEAEIAAMNQRREDVANKRRAERNFLLKLFSC